MTKQTYTEGDFIQKFCNDHNGEIRFLRGIFYNEKDGAEQILDFLNKSRVESEKIGFDKGYNWCMGTAGVGALEKAKKEERERIISEIEKIDVWNRGTPELTKQNILFKIRELKTNK